MKDMRSIRVMRKDEPWRTGFRKMNRRSFAATVLMPDKFIVAQEQARDSHEHVCLCVRQVTRCNA